MKLLSSNFLSNYPDVPEHMNELGQFVFYRTYSRWLPDQQRRETFKEAIERAVEYNVGISLKQFEQNNIEPPTDKIISEAETLFDNIFNLRQFLSGRTHWVGGAKSNVAKKFPLSNFNCAFVDITSWADLVDMFYLLLIGTGVGFRCSKENTKNLPKVRTNYKLLHSEYKPIDKDERLEHTKLNILDNGYAKIYIGDSKEGWVQALNWFFKLITKDEYNHIKNIKISYNSIRPRGEKLKTFGGTASGHETMKEMFEGIDKVFKNKLDRYLEPMQSGQVRPIHVLDIGNLIGNNVICGGVRRTAEIFLCDADDWESILAKYGINGIWNITRHKKIVNKLEREGYVKEANMLDMMPIQDIEARPMHHRRMSNNSIVFEEKPSSEFLELVFEIMKAEGEPGFANLESAKRRRPNAKGINPCGEVLLDTYGVCNLTTVNAMAFVKDNDGVPQLDYQGLMQAQALSIRAGLRMTCLDLELPLWDEIQKRDRLIAGSITGWKDAMEFMNYDKDQENNLLNFLGDVAFSESTKYSHVLRVPSPLLTTTVKPEGTLSQVANGVSSGLHVSYAPYYIRRIRINSTDPLVKVALELNWQVHPEVGTKGETHEERMQNARTYVIDFPVKSEATKTRSEQSAKEQLETYFDFQKNYTSHNSSNTISVKRDEWEEVQQIIEDNWDDFIGVTFMPYDGGSYELAPYEEITEKEYNELKNRMKPFDFDLLYKFEAEETEKDVENIQECDSGACPVF